MYFRSHWEKILTMKIKMGYLVLFYIDYLPKSFQPIYVFIISHVKRPCSVRVKGLSAMSLYIARFVI